jgi:hypothetical protein
MDAVWPKIGSILVAEMRDGTKKTPRLLLDRAAAVQVRISADASPQICIRSYYPLKTFPQLFFSARAIWAAARRAMGMRRGEQET